MAQFVEKEGKTVEAAIEEALNELKIQKKDAEVEVLDEGSKGLFGIIGGRNALVRVYKKINYEDIVKSFLNPVFQSMGLNEDMEIVVDGDNLTVKLSAENIGIVIGRRGETLDALQYLLGLAVNKYSDKFMRVTLDVGNYREKREETLVKLQKACRQGSKTRRI